MTAWGADRLTGDELAVLARKLDRAAASTFRQADRSVSAWQAGSEVSAEMTALRGEVIDQLITRRDAQPEAGQ